MLYKSIKKLIEYLTTHLVLVLVVSVRKRYYVGKKKKVSS